MTRKLLIVIWMMVAAGTSLAQQIDLKAVDKFASKATSKTEIDLDEAMLKSASSFLDDKKSDEALVKTTTKDLKGVYLRSYEFDQKGVVTQDDLKPILDQLKAPNWSRFLRNQEDGELTEIWMHSTNGSSDGILLVSSEESELTIINIVGSANLSDLAVLGKLGNLSAITNAKQTQDKAGAKKD
jgi:hypothetical protein